MTLELWRWRRAGWASLVARWSAAASRLGGRLRVQLCMTADSLRRILAGSDSRTHVLLAVVLGSGCVNVTGTPTVKSDPPDTGTPPDLMACPQYSGLTSGRVADYRYNDEQEALVGAFAWTETSFPTTATETEVGVLIVSEGDLDLVGFDSYRISTRTEGFCDADGYWITSYEYVNVYVFEGAETTEGTAITYSSPVLALPVQLEEGDTWSSDVAGQVVYTDGTEIDYAGTLDYTVLGFATIEVPAGSFDTLLVERAHPVHPLDMWLDSTVGLVASSTTELVSHIEYE